MTPSKSTHRASSTKPRHSRRLPNQGLDLTNPDAAQSVACAPLCLLSGLAAQAHVGQRMSAEDSPSKLRDSEIQLHL